MITLNRSACGWAFGLAMLMGIAGPRARAVEAPSVRMDLDATAVRILLGVGDREPVRWDGRVQLTGGEILRIEPWRMRPADEIDRTSGWKATSYQLNNPPQGQPRFSPTGLVLTLKAARNAELAVSTTHGEFRVAVGELNPGERRYFLDGRVMVDAVAPAVQITASDTENDFPSAATAPDGSVWVAFVAHAHRGPAALEPYRTAPESFRSLIPAGGGDQLMLTRFDGREWSAPVPFGRAEQDLWRPTLAVRPDGELVVAWSANQEGAWSLMTGTYAPGQTRAAGEQILRKPAGADVSVAAAAGGSSAWLAWQGWKEGRSDIWLASLEAGARSKPRAVAVTETPGNEWAPAVCSDSTGRIHVAYDTYGAGNYDVYLRSYSSGKLSEPVAVAVSQRFEARPSVACDAQDRVWVAYEQRAADWGKDYGPLSSLQGSPLYMRGSSVQVRCVEGGKLMQPAGDLFTNFPDDLKRHISYPRLAFDGRGRLWLLFRHRHEAIWGANPSAMMVGGVWLEYAACYDGESWSAPIYLAHSDNLLDVRPALALAGGGRGTSSAARLVAVYPSDGRLRREVIGEDHLRKIFFTGGGATVPGQAKSDLFAAVLPDLGDPKPLKLVAADAAKHGPPGVPPDVPASRGADALDPDPEPKSIHPNSTADLERIRQYRIEAGGKKYQLLRGEFHRHTEWSMDGAEDGSLEDMWRYAIDAAELDWMGSGDHDLGGGREYSWWFIQKATDVYHQPPRFVAMHTYERSVPYPNGHRNVMFDRRGIRTLPRLIGDDPGGVGPEDTKMLYRYLKEMGGICAVHTSGTGMGTDWRDNDPVAEPIVEIYQGDRNSYEALGGPRVARKQAEAIGGWRPLGMIWNAMAIGHKFGFQSSSDHWSTHISYAVAIAESPTRSAVLEAFQKRRCYGATDNIILDVRMGDALMGDEVRLPRGGRPPKLSVRVHGTAPLERVDLIKDFGFVYAAESKTPSLEFEWTDPEPRPGMSWYYVRVLQSDGQVAWGSPIWVQSPPAR